MAEQRKKFVDGAVARGVPEKKAERTLGAGAIGSYIHDGSIGAMVVLSSETDFVAKNPEFAALARDIAMQVAATAPASWMAAFQKAMFSSAPISRIAWQ